MDAAFLLDGGARTNFLPILMQYFRCTYICLWSYLPHPSNCLLFLDGIYHEENNQPSSSSGSLAQRLYDEYRQSVLSVDNEYDTKLCYIHQYGSHNTCFPSVNTLSFGNISRVPGLAFKNSHPYVELDELNLRRLASNEIQQQFYKEARVKIAVFMGCKSGEIELGWSNVPQINIEMEMRTWFPEDFSRQSPLTELPRPIEQNPPSSSSSSLRSLSMDSPEYSSLLFNIPSTTYIQETLKEAPIGQALKPISIAPRATCPRQQAMQALSRIRSIQLPTLESEDAAMTRAILAVLTSPSSSSSSHQPHQNLPQSLRINPQARAFKNYTSALAPKTQVKPNLSRKSMLNRAITYFRSLNLLRIHERMHGSRHTSTQLHHMISERKRREKINDSFQALRSLLPPGSKKDKASVLTNTKDYLTSLRAQVAELSRRNQSLEAQLLPAREAAEEATGVSTERLDIRVSHVPESTSEERFIDLRVTVRGECPMVDIVIRILEFLKQVRNISVVSMESNTSITESSSINRLNFRLKIEGSEWDEASFQEAVKRVIADLAV